MPVRTLASTRTLPIRAWAFAFVGLLLLSACESENDHFCSKYSYFTDELTAEGILPLRDLKPQLLEDLRKKPDSDHTKMALFVLADIDRDMRPANESARDYCVRRERWKMYR